MGQGPVTQGHLYVPIICMERFGNLSDNVTEGQRSVRVEDKWLLREVLPETGGCCRQWRSKGENPAKTPTSFRHRVCTPSSPKRNSFKFFKNKPVSEIRKCINVKCEKGI